MKRVGVVATLPHYARHLRPIWQRLPEAVRERDPGRADVVMVASGIDAAVYDKPTIYVEHGAGQSYLDGGGTVRAVGYSGGPRMERVVLFVCPSQTVADRWAARYPAAATVVVGCPALDRWHRNPSPAVDGDGPVVAVTFHWRCRVAPETLSAWPFYDGVLPALVGEARRRGWRLLGHEHPKWRGELNARWERLGVEVGSYRDVLDRATLLVADNTSLLPEVASLGRPVVWLNAPVYRRDVEHGGRFWEWPRGQVTVDEPADLLDGIAAALADPPDVRAAREAMVDSVYAHRDGCAADRAAAAVMAALRD